jgi:hypothetical protein
VALNTYLQYQGIECLEKVSGFNPDGAQVFALVVLFALALVSVLGTLVHLLNVRAMLEPERRRRGYVSPLSGLPIELANAAKLKAADRQLAAARVAAALDLENNNNNINNNNNDNNIAQLQIPAKGAPPVMATSRASNMSVSSAGSRRPKTPLVRLVDVLLHFSVIKNGRKLFDTSTSAGRCNSRSAGSFVPGKREQTLANGRPAPPAADAQPTQTTTTTTTTGVNGTLMADAPADTGSSQTTQITIDAGSVRSGLSSLESQSNDISCVHGLRFWTISWIILGHTMQYTEWAGFARAYQVEDNITSFLLHPILNATYSVDTFFLVSGLLTTYVTWTITRGHYWRFNKFAFLISRYLRLMPQVLIVILLFIIFPLMGEGPWWQGVVQKESDRCKQNWWVSALFLQSFYRQDQIVSEKGDKQPSGWPGSISVDHRSPWSPTSTNRATVVVQLPPQLKTSAVQSRHLVAVNRNVLSFYLDNCDHCPVA